MTKRIIINRYQWLGKGPIRREGKIIGYSDGEGTIKWTPPIKYTPQITGKEITPIAKDKTNDS